MRGLEAIERESQSDLECLLEALPDEQRQAVEVHVFDEEPPTRRRDAIGSQSG